MNIYSCETFLSSLALYTNSKYVSYVWTALFLCILTSSNISGIYMTASFELSIQRCSEIEVANHVSGLSGDIWWIFLVLFSSFELHIVWLNHLSTSILFDWTVPVAVHWLYRIWLNVLPSHILFAGPFT